MNQKRRLNVMTIIAALLLGGVKTMASGKGEALDLGDSAPLFRTQTHEGKEFDLSSRKGEWTVLYFYPKADTPGCTKQACAFRDNIQKIRNQQAEVFGISVNSVKDQAKFHEKYHLNFTLLADAKGEVVKLYGTKMPVVNVSKRWTFILDPELKIRAIEKDVDPALDAQKVADLIEKLKNS
jgi:peroxiredoxin Q/BCP